MTNFNALLTGKSLVVLSSVLLLAVLIIIGSQPARGAVWINDSNIYLGNKGHELLGTNNKNFRVCNYGVTENHRYESPRWPSWSPTYPASQRYRSTSSAWISPEGNPIAPPQTTISEGDDDVDLRMNFIGHYCTANMFDAAGNDPENYQDNYNWNAVNLDKQMVRETRLNTTSDVSAGRHPSAPASCNDDPRGLRVSDSIKNQPMSLDWDRAWGNPPGNRPFYVKPGGGDGQPLYKNFSVSGFSDLPPGCYSVRVRVETKSATRRASDNQWICSKNGAPTGPSGSGCPSLTYVFGITVNISDSQQEIRGYKVAERGVRQSDIENNRVNIDGGNLSTTSNPFRFDSISAGRHSVSVNAGGYDVRYEYCRNQNVPDCDSGSRRAGSGNSFTVNVPEGGFVDVRFYFSDIPLPPPEPSAELETDVTSAHQVAAPDDPFSIDAYVENTGEGESDPVKLRVSATSGDTGSIRPSRKTKDVGTLEPGDREDRSFRFRVKDNAREGDHVCFKSRAKESGGSWVTGSRRSCVGIVRNFDMRTRTYAPNGPEDELTGPFRVRGIIRNMRRRARDGMSTQGHDYIEVTLSVVSGQRYIKPLYNGWSYKAGRPTRSRSYEMMWRYSGSRRESFNPYRRTRDNDTVSAWTEVKKNRVEGRKRVCFRVKAVPRYRHRTIFRSYNGWGGIDTGSSYSSRDCTRLWEVRRPYVTTEDGDVHGGSVRVDPETAASEQCRNDNVDVIGRIPDSGNRRGSKSTYAVSATGRIREFGSNNSTRDGRLKFGNQPPPGNYQAVCRPDLTEIQYYRNLGYTVVRDGRRNIRGIINQINNERGRYRSGDEFVVWLTNRHPKVQGSNVTLKEGKRVTFVTRHRDFDIRSDVTMQGGSRDSVSEIPSLAIVAGGDIDIYRDVENIQAYIVSNGTVDTCGNVRRIDRVNRAPRCGDRLRIRGALVAKEIEFRRTSGDVGNSGPAEIIVYAPEIHLSPPPGIMGRTNNIFFGRPLWERLPFF